MQSVQIRRQVQYSSPVQVSFPYHHISQTVDKKNNKLIQQNKRLNFSMDQRLRQDWEDLHLHNERLEFINRHIFALQKITEELANSLSTLQRVSLNHSENNLKHQRNESIQNEQDKIIQSLQNNKECPSQLKQQLTQQLVAYNCKVTLLSSQLEISKANLQIKQQQINHLETQLAQASHDNAQIYHQLVETTHQLKLLEQKKRENIMQQELVRSATQPVPQRQNKLLTKSIIQHHIYQENQSRQHQNQIRKCHQEIVLLKQQLKQTKDSRIENRRSFESHKAQLQLQRILAEKKYEESQRQVRQLRKKVQLNQKNENPQFKDNEANFYEDEIYNLKIKLIALESLQVARLYKFNTKPNLDQLFNRLSPLTSSSQKIKDSFQLVARTFCIVSQLEQKLQKSQSQLQNAKKRASSYKEKLLTLAKSKTQMEKQLISSFKFKYNDYNRLIQKMQSQLEKFCQTDKQNQLQQMSRFITAPMQQKIQFAQTQIAFLQKQLTMKQQLLLKYQIEMNNSFERIRNLQSQNSNLLKINRQAQKSILQQQLSSVAFKTKQFNLFKLEKHKNNNIHSSQITSLHEQIAILQSHLQEKNDLLIKQKNRSQHILQLNLSQQQKLNQVKGQIQSLRNQHQNKNNSQYNEQAKYIDLNNPYLLEQLDRLKNNQRYVQNKNNAELQQMKKQNIEYRKRVEELEELLDKGYRQKQLKDSEFQKVQEQKDIILQRLQRLEQQFESLNKQQNSIQKIQSVSSKKNSFQEQLSKLQSQLAQKEEQIKSIKQSFDILQAECNSFQEDNLKLLFTLKEYNINIQDLNVSERYKDSWQQQKIKHLELKIKDMNEDNQVLKNLVDELREKIVNNKNHEVSTIQLKNALATAQNQADQLRQQNDYLRQQQEQDKQRFSKDWEKLVIQLNKISRQLENYKKGGFEPRTSNFSDNSERSYLVSSGVQDGKVVKSEIIDLMGQLEIKNHIIRQLREQIRRQKNKDNDSVGIQTEGIQDDQEDINYLRERRDLRQQNQKLRQSNYEINKRMRNLENQYNSFRLQMISSTSSLPKINFASAPYIQGQHSHKKYLPPINDAFSSQSERSSIQERQEINSKNRQSLKNQILVSSQPKIAENQRVLESLAPLVQSVREGNE